MEFKLEKAMQIGDYNKICTNLLACNLCGAATRLTDASQAA